MAGMVIAEPSGRRVTGIPQRKAQIQRNGILRPSVRAPAASGIYPVAHPVNIIAVTKLILFIDSTGIPVVLY